ncbi:MAG: glycine cleavage system protein H [Anaerolineae bacterium]|nr:MAG: glycine cleavage system protein H [Anaerolineae bacterium]
MSTFLSTLKYAKTDEWFDPATGKVGISDYAQDQLSDIVFMEITVSVGDEVQAGTQIASVESVKAASEVLAPVSGKVVAINEDLPNNPETINSDPYGAWFIQIEGGDPANLLDAAEYEKHCQERAH